MVFFISCGGMWQYGASTTGADSTADNEVYFRASGTEPFWSLEISANTNDMSGQVSPYRVKVESKKNTDVSFRELNGCGEYIETAAIP